MGKKLRFSYNAPVTLTLVLLCFGATVLGVITRGKATALLFSVYRSSLTSPLTYVRLVGHVLGHSGFEHFIGNAMLLLLLGPMLEEKYGSATVLKVFLCTAVVSGIFQWVFGGGSALCGASGLVFACITLSSFTSFRGNEIPISAVLVFLLFIGKEVLSGLFVNDDVSNLTHILGGLVGGGFGYLCNKK